MQKAQAVAITAVLLVIAPIVAFAQTPVKSSEEANKKCQQWAMGGGQGTGPSFSVPQPGGRVTCTCSGSVCNATSFTDANGNVQAIQNAMSFLGQALGLISQLLNQQKGGGSSGGGSTGSAPGVNIPEQNSLPSFAPASHFTTTGVANVIPNPPATVQTQIQTPPKPETSENFLEAVAKGFNNITNAVSQVTVGLTQTTTLVPQQNPPAETPTTNVQTNENGTTIVFNENNTGVSGFYGSKDTSGTASTEGLSLIGRLCVTRPWARGIVSWLIPASFFDGLCARGGYDVGALPMPTNGVNSTQVVLEAKQRAANENDNSLKATVKTGISCTPSVIRQGAPAALSFSCGIGYRLMRTYGFTAGANDTSATVKPQQTSDFTITCSNAAQYTCEIKVVNPRIVITADPQSVRLGSRTVIRWKTQDVDGATCIILGPSFKGTGGVGAGSTVPITGASVFTATCTALDGVPLVQTLTVDLAL